MNENRRSFLKKAAGAALGIGCGLPIRVDASTTQLAMVVDKKKCLRQEVSQACTQACRRAHNLPDLSDSAHEVKWIWTEEYQNVFPDQTHAHDAQASKEEQVLVMCNHCTNPPCVKVCPTQATWRREDGLVMMDMHRCIGCRYCMVACPYGSRSFNWQDPRPHIPKDENGRLPSDYPTRDKGVVEKCNFCAERLRDGLQPACVEAANKVPGGEGALTFGNLADPYSEVSKILQKQHTIIRRPNLGAGPNVYYIV
jgi:Fe-S-cluster-containing dehydrogenase component